MVHLFTFIGVLWFWYRTLLIAKRSEVHGVDTLNQKECAFRSVLQTPVNWDCPLNVYLEGCGC